MKAKSFNDEQTRHPSLDHSIQTRLQKKNSIFEPRPFQILKLKNKKEHLPAIHDSMVASFIQETEESEMLMKINKVLITACSFLSFILMYAMIFYVIDQNFQTNDFKLKWNINRDDLRFIYGGVWTLLLMIGFNFELHKIYLPLFE